MEANTFSGFVIQFEAQRKEPLLGYYYEPVSELDETAVDHWWTLNGKFPDGQIVHISGRQSREDITTLYFNITGGKSPLVDIGPAVDPMITRSQPTNQN